MGLELTPCLRKGKLSQGQDLIKGLPGGTEQEKGTSPAQQSSRKQCFLKVLFPTQRILGRADKDPREDREGEKRVEEERVRDRETERQRKRKIERDRERP